MKPDRSVLFKFVISIFALSLILASCSGRRDDVPPSEAAPRPAGAERPSHITRELTNGVSVDADITYPARREYEILTAKYADHDVETLKELFLADDPSALTVDTSRGITVTTENGAFVSSRYGRLLYSAADDKKYGTIEDLLWIYARNEAYFNDVQLPFMSRESARDEIFSILDKLGMIGSYELRALVGLDHSSIEAYQRRLKEDEHYAEIMDWGKLADLNGLTEADDAYFIRISFKRSDLPFFDRSTEQGVEFSGESADVPSSYAQALITAGGLKSLTVIGCYAPDETRVTTAEVIGLEDVLARVRDKYDLQIVTTPVTFTRIYMEYIPLRETTDGVKIVPYWTLEYGYTLEDGTFETAGAQRFNAVTGEDMAYGG